MKNTESLVAVHAHNTLTNEKTLVAFLHPNMNIKQSNR